MSQDDIKKKVAILPPVPEGMSKSQWKKVWKKQRYAAMKDEYSLIRKEKRKKARENRRAKIQEYIDRGEEIPEEFKRQPRENANQTDSGINIILDCAFDDLMNDKEIVSMSNQITRAYSSNKRENYFAHITVTSFNKRLKRRFDEDLKGCHYEQWKNFEFQEGDQLIVGPEVEKSKLIYLTADTDDKLDALEPGMTYIVGGIVDKNRHKLLCYNKAKELGITTKRLPIGEFINISGRKVLTTTHVIQLMLKYFDNHDWKEALEYVLPPRKLDHDASEQEENEK
ncbi:TRM10 (YOL093W) [Zygosaccharomyces parabailii]|nr:TRM10 (YOL093W) [Zygosaccharomyces parabailii]CDH10556.1 probable tRNA (guanine(9)-N1)-methyltransferase [Zygosaccharomyces bailii ISA1307]